MRFFENRVFHKVRKGKRALSLIAALLSIVGVIILVSRLIIPELVETIFKLSNNIPGYVKEIQDFLEHYSINKPMVHKYVNQITFDWDKISGGLISFLQDSATNMLNSTVSVISNAVQVVVSFGLGFVFALNALLQKERLSVQVRKVLVAFLPEKTAKYIVRVGRLSNNTFSSFLSGQCLEAVILGSHFCIYDFIKTSICSFDSSFYCNNVIDSDHRRIYWVLCRRIADLDGKLEAGNHIYYYVCRCAAV